jgi:FKBP-type peptidyl-prolyl cis-trans isomerase (trigger factor)
MERKMSILQHIRAEIDVASNDAAKILAEEMISVGEQYQAGQLSRDEFEFLIGEIAQVRAQQELATDEIAQRWIINAASAILSAV